MASHDQTWCTGEHKINIRDIAGLTALLEKNMNVDLNARDEFVGKKSTSWILMFADGFSTEIYTVASGSGSRKHGSCKVAIRKRR